MFFARIDPPPLGQFTGANGFLGTTLAISIFESGADVVCLDLAESPNASNWGKFQIPSVFLISRPSNR